MGFRRATALDVGDDERDEVIVAVGDFDFFDGVRRRFAGPGGLAGGAVAVEACS